MAREAKEKVQEIDRLVRGYPWMDFEIWEWSTTSLKIVGCIDSSDPYDLELVFSEPFFVSLPMGWKTDTSKTVLKLLEGDEAIRVNEDYRAEIGILWYQFFPEDFPATARLLVGARDVNMHRERPPSGRGDRS